MKILTSASLMRCISKIADLSRREKAVLSAMAQYADSCGANCYPGEKLLMEMTGYKWRDSITYALSALRKKGLILRDGKHHYTDKYQLNIPGMPNYVPLSELQQDKRGDYLTPERTPEIKPKQPALPPSPKKQLGRTFSARLSGMNIAAQIAPAQPAASVRKPPGSATDFNDPASGQADTSPIVQKPERTWEHQEKGIRTDGWLPPAISYTEKQKTEPTPEEKRARDIKSLRSLHALGLSPDKLRLYAEKHGIPWELVERTIYFRGT